MIDKFKYSGKADHRVTKLITKYKVNSCGRKRKYSLREAQRVADRMNARQSKRVHFYICDLCGRYHVGKDNK